MLEIIGKYGETSEERTSLDERMIIAGELDRIFTRTFIFELNTQSRRLCGKTKEEKYKSFIRMLETDGYQKELQEAYPVLEEMLTTRYQMVKAHLSEVRAHFDADYQEMIRRKLIKEPDVQIQKIQCTSGDTHNGAKRVMLLKLSDGSKILYKPHSLAVDKAFCDIISWFSRYLNIEFRTTDVLDKGSHGWCSYISPAPCMNKDQVRRYFYRYGVLIFVTKILGSTDLHYENLIASGEFPVIVDSEMLFGRGQTIIDSASDGISILFHESILHSGLLPVYAFKRDGEGVDVSAISGEGGVQIPIEIPTVVNTGRSDMHIEYQHPQTAGGNNRCKLQKEFQSPCVFLKEIRQGFIDGYQVAVEHREALIQLICSYSSMPVRVLLQNTQTYSSVLNISWHPRFLTKKGVIDLLH